MNITLTTDASYSYKHKVGSYAFYITCNLGRMSKSGALKKECACPSEAEMKCIINALTFISECPDLFSKCKDVFVNTDSMNAIHVFEDSKVNIKKYRLKKYLYLQARYNKVKSIFGDRRIDFRHVKAHSGKDDKRSWVNEFCDKAAKEQLHLLIDKLEKK